MATVKVRSTTGLQQEITSGSHVLTADEPRGAGGDDAGPDPYALLLASLGACTSMTLHLYAKRKQWDLRNVSVTLAHQKIHAQDCADCETKEGRIDVIERRIEREGNLTDDQKARLFEIAKRCPVHRTLTSEIKIIDL